MKNQTGKEEGLINHKDAGELVRNQTQMQERLLHKFHKDAIGTNAKLDTKYYSLVEPREQTHFLLNNQLAFIIFQIKQRHGNPIEGRGLGH